MRFEVPQFIEVEDKIIGPLTWKQFVYLAGGTGMLVILFFTLPRFIFIIIGLPLGALAGFLAFHRINNRPFSIFLEAAVNYVRKHKLYLWKREEQAVIMHGTRYSGSTNPITQDGAGNLASLSRKLEIHTLQK